MIPARLNFTEDEDTLLKKCYASNSYGNNAHRKAVSLLKKSSSAVLYRAVELGLTFSRERYRWTEEEIKLLEKYTHLSPESIQRKLKTASPLGIKRTRSAIIRQIHRNKLRTNLDGLNHAQLSQALGISVGTLHSYRCDGLIRAEGHVACLNEHHTRRKIKPEVFLAAPWFYKNEEIRKFIATHPGLINFHAVDGVWLIDLLLNGRYQSVMDNEIDRVIRRQRKVRNANHVYAVHGQVPRI